MNLPLVFSRISHVAIVGSGLWIVGMIVREVHVRSRQKRDTRKRLDEVLRGSGRAQREEMRRHVNGGGCD